VTVEDLQQIPSPTDNDINTLIRLLKLSQTLSIYNTQTAHHNIPCIQAQDFEVCKHAIPDANTRTAEQTTLKDMAVIESLSKVPQLIPGW
jgi:hypothetical protein